jgi:hypothetical protein
LLILFLSANGVYAQAMESTVTTENMMPAKKTARNKTRTSRGPLHDVLTIKFPDLYDKKSKVCNLHKLADELKMSAQGVYKWMKPGRQNRIPKAAVDSLIEISARQISGDKSFKSLTVEDVWAFVSG